MTMYRFICGLPLLFGAITSHAIAQQTNTTLPHLISAVVPGAVSIELSGSQQVAKSPSKSKVTLEALEAAIIRQNMDRIRRIGTQGLRERAFSLHQIRMLAEKFDSAVLLHSVNGAKSLYALHKEVKISLADSFLLASFIESVICLEVKHYFSKKKFKLPKSVERDPKTNKIYIHIKTCSPNRIRAGKNRRIVKSILYDRESPELIFHRN